MNGELIWPIVRAAARRLAAPLLGAGIALLLDAGLLDGAVGLAVLDVLNRS